MIPTPGTLHITPKESGGFRTVHVTFADGWKLSIRGYVGETSLPITDAALDSRFRTIYGNLFVGGGHGMTFVLESGYKFELHLSDLFTTEPPGVAHSAPNPC